MRSIRLPLLILVACPFLIVAFYFGVYAFSKPKHYVRVGTPIQQDDFTYTVTAARKTTSVGLGDREVRAHGIFYVVSVTLDNHAVRVPFDWDDHIVQLIDASGHRYPIADAAQRELNRETPADRSIPAGSFASFTTVFDVPKDIQRPAVGFENGILMGDALNFVAYRRIAVALN